MINTGKSEIYNKLGCDAAAKGSGTFCSLEKIREPKTAEKTRLEQHSLHEEELVYSKVGLQIEKREVHASHKNENS
jgi:hypothetical protein